MSHISDGTFFKNFSLLVGALLVLTVVLGILASIVASLVPEEQTAGAQSGEQTLAQRISPVGQLKVAGVGGAGLIQTANAAGDGKSTYEGTCAVCHVAGVAGAPKFGDKAAWKDRIAQGKETLYEHALKGFQGEVGMMPPKGGRMDLSDEDVKAAVDYMVSNSQ